MLGVVLAAVSATAAASSVSDESSQVRPPAVDELLATGAVGQPSDHEVAIVAGVNPFTDLDGSDSPARHRAADQATTDADCTGGGWATPLDPFVPTARFGARGPYWAATHTGIDLAAPVGRQVLAVDAGLVTYAGWDGPYGRRVEIIHPNGNRTWYAHLSAIVVPDGSRVAAGDVIGSVGTSGSTTGPHLHFEVRVGERPVDPLSWLRTGELPAGWAPTECLARIGDLPSPDTDVSAVVSTERDDPEPVRPARDPGEDAVRERQAGGENEATPGEPERLEGANDQLADAAGDSPPTDQVEDRVSREAEPSPADPVTEATKAVSDAADDIESVDAE